MSRSTIPKKSSIVSFLSQASSQTKFDAAPIRLAPWYRKQIWGGRNLEKHLSRELPSSELFGESWEISTHPLHISRVNTGVFEGQLLTEVWSQFASEISGGQFCNGSPFPFLLKFLDCEKPVSIQVHPSDEIAQRLLNEPNGKSEAWVVVHAEPQAVIYSGFRQKVSKAEVEAAIEAGTLADLLHSFKPEVGDCISIPAGIAHSVGHGVLILEVQQLSDATFRMYDWQRIGPDGNPRQLHIDESFESIDWSAGAVRPSVPVLLSQSDSQKSEVLLHTDHFQICRHQFQGEIPLGPEYQMAAIAITQGTCCLVSSKENCNHELARGDVALLPAIEEGWTCVPVENAKCELISIIAGKR